MRTMFWAIAITFGCYVSTASGDQSPSRPDLMTKGKLEADLGNHTKAADAFASIANDASVDAALRAEALVRLALARSAAGDTAGALEALEKVREHHSSDKNAVRFAIGALAAGVPGKVWGSFRSELEELLRSAEIESVVDVGAAKGSGKIVRLKSDSFKLRSVWRPNELGAAARHSRELAAYEIDKLLGLEMVPPSVAREIDGQLGSLQFWVNGIHVFGDTKEIPQTPQWSRQLARMKLFDSLLGNTGRNLNNMLVDRHDNLMLIDFIAAFSNLRTLSHAPMRFERQVIERLKVLGTAESRAQLKRVLDDDAIESLLARRDALLKHAEKLIAERGEAAVLF